jgi:hypothetical protein
MNTKQCDCLKQSFKILADLLPILNRGEKNPKKIPKKIPKKKFSKKKIRTEKYF